MKEKVDGLPACQMTEKLPCDKLTSICATLIETGVVIGQIVKLPLDDPNDSCQLAFMASLPGDNHTYISADTTNGFRELFASDTISGLTWIPYDGSRICSKV